MQTLFTTRGNPASKTFDLWREVLREQFVPSELTPLGETPFEGSIAATSVGDLPIAHVVVDALKTEVTASTIRRHDKGDMICAMIFLDGSSAGAQYGRESVQKSGDIVFWDSKEPAVMAATSKTSVFLLDIPRRKFEEILGPARLYSSLTIDGSIGGASLATTYLKELVHVQNRLDPLTASRMALIGLDLLTAAISQQMQYKLSQSIAGDVMVQRAKSYAMANLSVPDLSPAMIAGSLGISLRRLQELFHDRGRYVADWIWEQRLEKASRTLSDPGRYHIAIGTIAYDCGFINQSHFSTRFKRRFGLAPREFRMRALQDARAVTAQAESCAS